jgi:hypothetical protein
MDANDSKPKQEKLSLTEELREDKKFDGQKVAAVIGVTASCITIFSFVVSIFNLLTISATVLGFLLFISILAWIGYGIQQLTVAVRTIQGIHRTIIRIKQTGINPQAPVSTSGPATAQHTSGPNSPAFAGGCTAAGGSISQASQPSVADRIKQLHDLHESGSVPDNDYRKKLDDLLKQL